ACGKSAPTQAAPSAANSVTAAVPSSASSTAATGTSHARSGTKTPATTSTATSPAGSGTELDTFFGPRFDSSAAFCTFPHQLAAVAASVLTVTYPAGSSAPSAGAPYGGAQICE